MKTTQLAAITRFSRQWLSDLAERGEVPGAVRRENGRWDYPDSPELTDWAMRQGRVRKAKIRRRADISAKEIRRLERLKRRAIKAATRAKLQKRIDALKERAGNYLTVAEVAHWTGFKAHRIRRTWRLIPGAVKRGRELVFLTDEVAGWLEHTFRKNKFSRSVRVGLMDNRITELLLFAAVFHDQLSEVDDFGLFKTASKEVRAAMAEILDGCAKFAATLR